MAKKKKQRAKPSLYGVFAAALIVVLVAIGLGVFFRVNKVSVEGASYYSDEEILETAKLSTGHIIFLTDTDDAAQRLYEAMPYIYSVDIVRRLPDELVVRVNESKGICVITLKGERWLMDEHCKVLSKAEGIGSGSLLTILGLNAEGAKIGSVLEVSEDHKTHLESLINILKAFKSADILSRVSDLDVSNISNAIFTLDGKFTVSFGNGVDAERKVSLLIEVADRLRDETGGRIDLTREGRAHYIPE